MTSRLERHFFACRSALGAEMDSFLLQPNGWPTPVSVPIAKSGPDFGDRRRSKTRTRQAAANGLSSNNQLCNSMNEEVEKCLLGGLRCFVDGTVFLWSLPCEHTTEGPSVGLSWSSQRSCTLCFASGSTRSKTSGRQESETDKSVRPFSCVARKFWVANRCCISLKLLQSIHLAQNFETCKAGTCQKCLMKIPSSRCFGAPTASTKTLRAQRTPQTYSSYDFERFARII